MKFNLDEFTLFNVILEGEHLTIRNGSNCHVTHCSLLVGFWGRFPSPIVVLFYDVLFALFIGVDVDSVLAKVTQ